MLLSTDGILLGGILVMYEFHNFLRPILLLMYSFWIPQIITNVVRDSRKFLHPHYILGISVTRLAIPLYIFGCPHNFMRIEPDKNWCICLCVFIGLQASILLLQHYLGSRWFIPRQVGYNSGYFLHAKSHIFWFLSCFQWLIILQNPFKFFDYWLKLGFMACRSYLRSIAIIEGLIREHIIQQTVLFVWLPLILCNVLMIAWYVIGI